MLADPQARRAGRQFRRAVAVPAQSEELRRPTWTQFPDFDDNLRQAMKEETKLFFDSIMREDRSVLDLLNADYTFVNERLARHYGIPERLRQPVPARAGDRSGRGAGCWDRPAF